MKTGIYKAIGTPNSLITDIIFPVIGYIGIDPRDGYETFFFADSNGDNRALYVNDFIFDSEPLIEVDEDTRYEIKNITENLDLKSPFDNLIYTHSEDDNTIRIWKSNLDRNNITLQKFVNEIYTQTKQS